MSVYVAGRGGSGPEGARSRREVIRRETEEFWRDVMPAVASAVERTFEGEGGMATNVPFSEVKRRTELAKRLVDELRRDLGWSKMRIRDNLFTLLRARIVGLAVDPEAISRRGSWFADR